MKTQDEIGILRRAFAKMENPCLELADDQMHVAIGRYLSEEWFEAEKRNMFFRVPSILVHGSELPEPHSFVTLEHFGKSILICRNASGEANAFLNVCRHRGTIVEPAERGCKRSFTCRYHAWTYDTNGRLERINQSDHFLWITSHPVSAVRTVVKLRLMIPKEKTDDRDTMAWEDNRQFTYQVQYEDLDVYEAMQQGFRTDASGEIVFGTHENGLQAFAASIDGYVMGGGGFGTQEG